MKPAQRARGIPGGKWVRIVAIVFLVLVAAVTGLIIARWPFRRSAVVRSLERASGAPVEIASFRRTYFPPGCIATGVVIRRRSDPATPPLITIEKLAVEGDYYRIFTFSQDLRAIRTDGMHIRILTDGRKSSGEESGGPQGARMQMDELTAERTTLEFDPAAPGKEPFVIAIHHVRLAPVSGHKAFSFATDLRLSEPPGEVHASGTFGPWNEGEPYRTPVAGSYSFRRADLGFASGIGGMLDSSGRFDGVIEHIEVHGSTAVPAFHVRSAKHDVNLTAAFRAVVNGKTGDVSLEAVDVRFRQTDVRAAGGVASPAPHDPKKVSLEMSVPAGRIEDFLYLLTQGTPGLVGNLSVQCTAALLPGREPFLRKLRLNGAFRIARARFTRRQTQASLDRISRRERGEEVDGDDGDVLSNLQGRVSVAGGIARFESVTFEVPGASAHLAGTYDLVHEVVDLRGTAHLARTLSKTTTGVKSFLLKIVQPFVEKRRGRGADVPIKISGRWGNTSVGLDL